jgi:hypothetical protein
MGNEMATALTPGAAPADVYHALECGRLRRGVHYIVDEEPDVGDDGFEDGPPHFGQCTPERRAAACPVCAAAAGGVVPEHVIEAYHVTSSAWLGGCILPDLRSTLDVIGEEIEGGAEGADSVEFSVSRWWMLRAEIDRLPEFEG